MTEQQIIDKYGDRISGNGAARCGLMADLPINGYIKFRTDGTFQVDEMDGITIGYSESCLASLGQSCESAQSFVYSEAAAPDKKICTSSDGICTCSISQDSDPHAGSYTADEDTYQLYDEEAEEAGTREYCIQGNVFSVFAPSETMGGVGVAVAVRMEDTVVDIDASVTLPGFDASPDAFRAADAATDKPGVDALADKPKADAGVVDAKSNEPKGDAMPVDVSPVSPEVMVPLMAAVCQTAAPASAPCGGDLTGNWNIVGVCDQWLTESEFLSKLQKDCSISVDYFETGMASFNSDGTCAMDDKMTFKTGYSTSCLASANDTCIDKDQRIRKEVGTDYVSEASCAASSPDVCLCNNTIDSPAAADACTYSLKSSELTFISPPSSFGAEAYGYCVQGNKLTIFFPSWSSDANAVGDKATLTFAKAN
jgi:hypothetical protein